MPLGETSSCTGCQRGWQVVGRIGGADGVEAPHYFEDEAEARRMVEAMISRTPPDEGDYKPMTAIRQRPR